MTDKTPNSPLGVQDSPSSSNLIKKVKRNIHIHGKRTTMVLAQGFWDWYDKHTGGEGKDLNKMLEMLPQGKNFSDIARIAAIKTSMREADMRRYSGDELHDSAGQFPFPSIYHEVCDDLKKMEEEVRKEEEAKKKKGGES
ncbi:MAG: ribbon-helix-helix domain-containing protein [Proteobacteria bacterium]|nr:ribbon-helix-helix domain-containing protein [Pseudomonadota bacterium]